MWMLEVPGEHDINQDLWPTASFDSLGNRMTCDAAGFLRFLEEDSTQSLSGLTLLLWFHLQTPNANIHVRIQLEVTICST